MPYIDIGDKPLALYHGLCAVAQDCAGMPPRFDIPPLPKPWPDFATLKRWFRQLLNLAMLKLQRDVLLRL
jgi:hypothetical protein